MRAEFSGRALPCRLWLALVLLFFGVLPATANAVVAAMVTDLQGKASVSEGGKSFAATILAAIEVGAQVQLQAPARLVLLYLDRGDEYVFTGPAEILFKAGQPEVVSGAKAEKRNSSLGTGVRIKPVGIGQGALVMRSFPSNARLRLLTLAGTRVLASRPEFRWQDLQPGLTYQFEISDDTGRSLHEARVAATALTLPAGMQLKEGAAYSWEVSARLADGIKYSATGAFSVASAELRAQAIALKPDAAAPVSARVAYAAWLEQVDLRDEASGYWRSLFAERPEDLRLKALGGR